MQNGTNRALCVFLAMCVVCMAAGSSLAAAPVFTKPVTTLFSPTLGVALKLQSDGLALADFNNDGQLDIAIAGTYMSGVGVFLNNGAGNATLTWYKAGRSPAAVAPLDLASDGYLDLAVALRDEDRVVVLLNQGAGQFEGTSSEPVGAGPCAMVSADMDNDGRQDLVVANRTAGTVSILFNRGGGLQPYETATLPAVLPAGTPAVSSEPNGLAVADLNNDTLPDVAVACAADDSVKILTNTGGGALSLTGTFPAGPYPVALAAGDLNGDLAPDLVVADREGPQVTVLLQGTLGSFVPQDVFLVTPPAAFTPAADVALVDLNGDGKLDIRTAGYALYGKGLGQFGPAQPRDPAEAVFFAAVQPAASSILASAVGGSVSLRYYSGVAGDISGDGKVNVFDLQRMAGSWAKQAGQGGFDPDCDLNGDGKVNIFDLQVLAANWAK